MIYNSITEMRTNKSQYITKTFTEIIEIWNKLCDDILTSNKECDIRIWLIDGTSVSWRTQMIHDVKLVEKYRSTKDSHDIQYDYRLSISGDTYNNEYYEDEELYIHDIECVDILTFNETTKVTTFKDTIYHMNCYVPDRIYLLNGDTINYYVGHRKIDGNDPNYVIYQANCKIKEISTAFMPSTYGGAPIKMNPQLEHCMVWYGNRGYQFPFYKESLKLFRSCEVTRVFDEIYIRYKVKPFDTAEISERTLIFNLDNVNRIIFIDGAIQQAIDEELCKLNESERSYADMFTGRIVHL